MRRVVLRSGALELDPGVHQVRESGDTVDLTPRVFDLLHCLMRHAPHLVERADLLHEVWQDVHVCESAIFQAVRTLRVALGDSGERVRTVRGRGYRFDGPVTEVDPSSRAGASIPESNRSSNKDMTRRTVLIVDDDPDIVDALTRTLRGIGCLLREATSGQAALAIVASEPIDLIISDIDMPDMSGLDMIALVRVTNPEIIRLILTGVASVPVAVRAINDGEVYRFLTKPWNSEQLRRVVREGLARCGTANVEVQTAPAPRPSGTELALSPRLRQTLTELMSGAPEKEIASRLRVSPHTAHQYIKTLYRRFGVASRVQLMVKVDATRHGAHRDSSFQRVGS